MKSFLLLLIDLAEAPFAYPHDWRIVEWVLEWITPKHIWDYYGNPLCYAYNMKVSHFFYRLYAFVAET